MEEVGKLLPTIFRRQMRRENAHIVEILGPLWMRVAGKEIAEHSRPVEFAAGTLTLGTSCPSWAAQLRLMTEELRAEINKFLGCTVVKKLQVRLAVNLERSDAAAPRDGFLEAEARKLEMTFGVASPTTRVVGRSKMNGSAPREGRLD